MHSLLPILAGVLLLLAASAFFSGSESALMSLGKAQLRRLKNESALGRLVYKLLKNSQRTMGTILLGNLFVNTLLAALTAELLTRHLSDPRLGALFSILLVTPVLILLGELLPKINALRFNVAAAKCCAPILLVLSWLFTPFLWLLDCCCRGVQALLGLKNSEGSWESLTSGELVATIDVATSGGAATRREHELLARILRFGTIQAKEIMLPRPQIPGLDDSLTLREAFPLALKSDLGDLPVYHGNPDEIWGALSFADLLKIRNSSLADTPLAAFRAPLENGDKDAALPVTPVEFVPGAAPIDRLLETMRKDSLRICVVVSEHGGTLGMVTPSMILEEVVGRYAFSGQDVNRLQKRPGGLLGDGRARFRAVEESLQWNFSDTEAETLAGFVMERLGRIPAPGDAFVEDGCRFQVVRTAGRIPSAILISRQPEAAQDTAEKEVRP